MLIKMISKNTKLYVSPTIVVFDRNHDLLIYVQFELKVKVYV